MFLRFRWLMVACLAVAGGSLASGASAQSESAGIISPPPERLLVTPGGVDMRTGEYNYEQTDVSIGEDSEAGGIELTRTMKGDVLGHINPFGNFSHNWDVMVSEKFVNIQDGDYTSNSGSDQRISVHFGGRSETFEKRANQTIYEQVSRNTRATLTASGPPSAPLFIFQASDGTIVNFRSIGNGDCSSFYRCAYASSITMPDGTRFDFQYENPTPGVANTTRLRRVTSSRGYALLLEYAAASWNSISKACVLNLAFATAPANNVCSANAAATSTYAYSGSGASARLTGVTDPQNAVWGFSYTPVSGGVQMGFIKPNETTPWLLNRFSEQMNNEGLVEEIIDRQDFADGSFYTYTYNYTPEIEGQFQNIAGGTYTNALSETVTLEYGFFRYPGVLQGPEPPTCCNIRYQITPGPISVTDALNRTTLTSYCDPNALANLPSYEQNRCVVWPVPHSVTDPMGHKVLMTWDLQARNLLQSRRVALTGSGLAEIVTSATYDCLSPFNCAKPMSVTDARGYVTNYTYSTVHGGILTETGPPLTVVSPTGSTTTNVRPQTRYSYVQRNAWVSNGAAGFVQVSTPVWLLDATSMCRTSAATGNPASPCTVTGDEVKTTFDYGPNSGPNNLLLRGQVVTADGVSLRTCYQYDQRGRRIAETQPNANLSTCS